MNEEWRKVIHKYSVSNYGRVRNDHTGRCLKQKIERNGYASVCLSLGHRGTYKTVKVHRLVAKVFIENPNNLPQVNHKDGDKLNNNVCNLEFCTAKYNVMHSIKNGLQPIGEKCSYAKLSQKDIDDIKNMYNNNIKIIDISNIYDVHRTTISKIIHGHRWKTKR